MVKSDSTSRLGVEQSGIVRDVIVFIASHFGQRVVSFQNGQSFAEKFQRLALEQLAESRAKIHDQFSSMVFENHFILSGQKFVKNAKKASFWKIEA